MKIVTSFLAVVFAVCSRMPALGDAPLIWCQCDAENHPGNVHYYYNVDSASYPMMEFHVGAGDLEIANYADILVPPGWNFAVEPSGMAHAHGLFAPHGEYSEGPCYCLTAGRAHWWTDDPALAVEFFVFGFQHSSMAEDVGWTLVTQRPGEPPESHVFLEDWESPVGVGMGPLHGPSGLSQPEYCWSNDDCDPDYYCLFEVCAAETGVCMPRPAACTYIWDPVCGCDGVTYANACYAALAGVSVDYEGACDGSYCWSNDDCDPGFYCRFDGCAAETGVCTPRPETCPYTWDPVCGCDGQTYANACAAAATGVSIAYESTCITGDLDLDGDVDLADLAALLSSYGKCIGDPYFLPAADFDGDGCVDLSDLAELLANYGA